jgi:hypothetical protein
MGADGLVGSVERPVRRHLQASASKFGVNEFQISHGDLVNYRVGFGGFLAEINLTLLFARREQSKCPR